MQVIFYPDKQNPPRKGALFLDDVRLIPGNNNVDPKITQHPDYKKLVALGAIRVVGEKSRKSNNSGSSEITLSELSIDDATPVIEAETDLDRLREWQKDSRTGIKNLVSRRIKEIEEGRA